MATCKAQTIKDLLGIKSITPANFDDVLRSALHNRITELVVSSSDYSVLEAYAIGYGAWNWDRETILGIKITVDYDI